MRSSLSHGEALDDVLEEMLDCLVRPEAFLGQLRDQARKGPVDGGLGREGRQVCERLGTGLEMICDEREG